jgi:uncharacterized protein YybS (DUF2232 family)
MEGSCYTCPTTDSAFVMIMVSVGVVIGAPILFKVSEQFKNLPALNLGISFSQSLGLFSFQMEYPKAGAYTAPLLSST